MSSEEKKVSRRGYVKYAGAAVVVVAVGAAGAYYATQPPAPPPTTPVVTTPKPTTPVPTTPVATTPGGKIPLVFTVWNYSVETIKDNTQRFMQVYPDIEVALYDFNWPDFPTTMVKRFTTKTQTDVTYEGEDWLAMHVEGGWLAPLDDYWDYWSGHEKTLDFYKSDMVPYALQSVTYKDKCYGLPYYSDMFEFMYNKKALEEIGLSGPPKDWNEVLDACFKLQAKGYKYPYTLEYQADNPHDWCCVLSAAYGRGARLFDKDLNAIFQTDKNFSDQLQWFVDGINKHKVVNPDYIATHETVAQKKLGAGEGAMTLLAGYNLAAMNVPEASPLAGNFRLGLMPGSSHEAYGYAKFYALTKMCVDRGRNVTEAAIKFLEYFGGHYKGTYQVLKRWAVEKGLGFGYVTPFDDADIIKAFDVMYGPGGTGDTKEQAKLSIIEPHPVWYNEWLDFVLKESLAKAFAQEITVAQCVDRMASRWKDLKTG